MLEPLKEIYDPENYKKIIERNVIHTLTDESPEDKLLGIQIDMDYDR